MALGTPTVQSGSGTTSGTTASFTVSAGDFMIAMAAGRRSTVLPAQPTISDTGGGTWTEIVDQSYDPGANPRLRARFFKQYVATGGTITVTASCSDGTTTAIVVMIVSGAANDATNYAVVNEANGDPAPTLSSVGGTSAIFGIGFFTATNLLTPATGYTEILDTTANAVMRIGAQYDLTSPGLAASWTSTNTNSIGFAVEIKEATTGGTGTLSATIDPVTLSSNGALAIAGSLSSTVAAITLSASGQLAINGALSSTIAPVTLSSAGSLAITGTMSATLDPITLSASGSSVINGTGTLSATIPDITLSSAGQLAISGSLNATIAAITLSSSAVTSRSGSLDATIDPITLTASATITQPVSSTPDRSRLDQFEIRHSKPLRSWTDEIERFVAEAIEAERKDDRPKSRKVKQEVVQEVIEAVGNGILATVRPTPEIRQAIGAALVDDNADRGALYARVTAAIQYQLDEQDDEDVIMLLLAA